MPRREGDKNLLPGKQDQKAFLRRLRDKAERGCENSMGWLLLLAQNKQFAKEMNAGKETEKPKLAC